MGIGKVERYGPEEDEDLGRYSPSEGAAGRSVGARLLCCELPDSWPLFASLARGADRYEALDEREIAADLIPWLEERPRSQEVSRPAKEDLAGWSARSGRARSARVTGRRAGGAAGGGEHSDKAPGAGSQAGLGTQPRQGQLCYRRGPGCYFPPT